MASSYMSLHVNCCISERPLIPTNYHNHLKEKSSSCVLPWTRALNKVCHVRIDVFKAMESMKTSLLNSLVDSVFEFVDQPLLPSQGNFAPVDEQGVSAIHVADVEGEIPRNFPAGPNPLFGGLKSTQSLFGKSYRTWVEGEGMLHALYFSQNTDFEWTVNYNNRYVETETFKLEKQRNKPSVIPIIEGDLMAIISASLLNLMRFGRVDKCMSNTNVFEHSGKLYSVAENYVPQEINISTLETLGNWDLSAAWSRAFTSHPKRAPGTEELVIMGMSGAKPFYEYGVISADGTKLLHRADLKFDRCSFCHDFGVTERFNVFMDFPLTLDVTRLLQGGQLIKHDKKEYARLGVMPRYGDADSIKWFEVATNCTFHIINCFEDGDDAVVVWGCRALESVLPGPGTTGPSKDRFEASVRDGLLHDRPYEWRLNMRTGRVTERYLVSKAEPSMDFPFINEKFSGLKNKFGYTHIVDIKWSSIGDNMPKFSGLAKLHFEEHDEIPSWSGESEGSMKTEYHMFEDETYCSGATFVHKHGRVEEDDGWIVTFVHDEHTNTSQFSGELVAKITLPRRVPYGFHGAFITDLKIK